MTKMFTFLISALILSSCNLGTTTTESIEFDDDTIQEGYEVPIVDRIDSSSAMPSRETSNKSGKIATH